MNSIPGSKYLFSTGASPQDADYAFIMLHGRGSDVNDMQSVMPTIMVRNVHAILAKAPLQIMPGRFAWYPHFWNTNLEENMKYLGVSFNILEEAVNHLGSIGFGPEKTILVGHSQGANVMLEYILAHPKPFKAVISMRGCILGAFGDARDFKSEMQGSLIMLNAGRHDPYIPEKKIDQTLNTLKRLGGHPIKTMYETGHGICRSELVDLRKLVRSNFEIPA